MTSQQPRMVEQLVHDHQNMRRLLAVMEEELRRYRAGGNIDFEVMSRILDYVLNFPELRHHPREDLVLRHLRERDAAGALQVEGIMAEHGEQAVMSRRLSAALRNLQQDCEMPRPWLESLVDGFIAKYRDHMRKEEESYFPTVMRCLQPSDWAAIDAEAADATEDPLFGGKIDAEYQALHDRILRLAS